jgi:hypothetical protein
MNSSKEAPRRPGSRPSHAYLERIPSVPRAGTHLMRDGLASLDARQTLEVSVRLDFGWDRRRDNHVLQSCVPCLGFVIPLPPSRRFSGAVKGSGSL